MLIVVVLRAWTHRRSKNCWCCSCFSSCCWLISYRHGSDNSCSRCYGNVSIQVSDFSKQNIKVTLYAMEAPGVHILVNLSAHLEGDVVSNTPGTPGIPGCLSLPSSGRRRSTHFYSWGDRGASSPDSNHQPSLWETSAPTTSPFRRPNISRG